MRSKLVSLLFRPPSSVGRIWCMQTVIYVLWLGLNLVWQIPGALILNAILGIYLFFVFPHMVGEQACEDAAREAEVEVGASGGPDSETLLETTCRHLEQMRSALEQVDTALGTLQRTHQSRFETLEEALTSLVQDTQRRALRRERDAARKTLTEGSGRKNTQPLVHRERAEEEEEADDGQDHREAP